MKRAFAPWLARGALLLAGCADDDASGPTPPSQPTFGVATPEELVEAMTLEEKVAQMHGASFAPVDGLYLTPDDERLGIPGFRMVDGPRGVRAGSATAFPVAASRGASFDVDLERRVGRAIGLEAKAKGANVLLAPTMNVLRHPAWGRAQETYGEDTHHVGSMAVAFIEGAQEHVLASAKHFACNSIEDTRFDVSVEIDERSLREVYLPHFRRAVVDARVASVMTAYNKVNGVYASENAALLRDILKGEWAFDGFVESDWVFGVHGTVSAANAGLDVEMPAANHFGPALAVAVEAGEVDEAVVDEAVTRILRKKTELGEGMTPTIDPSAVESAEHLALAREAASAGMVLLKNDDALPLDPGAGSLVVVGSLAAVANLGDEGSSAVTPTRGVSPLEGLEERAEGLQITFVEGPALSASDEAAIAAADAVVVVVGLTTDDEGEGLITDGGDRETLSLAPEDEALVQAVAALSSHTVVVLEGGSAIVVRPFVDDVEALVMAWYPGGEGGHALADVLFGDVDPGGRLPVSFPRDEADLVAFDHTSEEVTYGLLHGYRQLDADGLTPEFPFGFGLSYSAFTIDEASVNTESLEAGEAILITVRVTNVGARRGAEVVQAYVRTPGLAAPRAPRDLHGFAKITLEPGETGEVVIPIGGDDLAWWSSDGWALEPGAHIVEIGRHAGDVALDLTIEVEP